MLQALLGTHCFANDLKQGSELAEDEDMVQIFSEISRFKKEGNQKKTSQAIVQLRHKLSKALPQLVIIRMQDAHEFLVFFCEHLEKLFVKLGQEKNPFSENFHFQLEEERVCCRCHHLTQKVKEDFVLRIDMPSSPVATTEKIHTMKMLLGKTLLGSGIEVTCPKCAKDESANIHESKDTFKTLPPVLILYLPRSQYFNKQQHFCKNRVQIDIDVVLDLKEYILENKVDKCKISRPNFQKEKSQNLWSPVSMTNCDSNPNKSPKLSSEADLTTDGDISMLSEDDQMKLAIEQSLKSTSKTYSSPVKLSPGEVLSNGDISKLSEEDQFKLAVEQSLVESMELQSKRNEEENSSLMQALEASMKTDQTLGHPIQLVQKERHLEINGKLEATGDYEYQLTAVISHVNSISSVETGHYIADVFK